MDKGVHELRRDYWRQIIRECNARDRGVTKLAWLQEHDINSKSYYYWQKQFRSEAVASVKTEAAKLEPVTAEPVANKAFFEITTAVSSSVEKKDSTAAGPIQQMMPNTTPELMIQISDCRIFVNSNIQEETLETVLKVLRHA